MVEIHADRITKPHRGEIIVTFFSLKIKQSLTFKSSPSGFYFNFEDPFIFLYIYSQDTKSINYGTKS